MLGSNDQLYMCVYCVLRQTDSVHERQSVSVVYIVHWIGTCVAYANMRIASVTGTNSKLDIFFFLLCDPSWGVALSVASVRLSVCPSVPCLRFSRNMKAVETSNLLETTRVTTGEQMWGLKVNGYTGNKNVQIVFRTYLRQEWIDLRQTNKFKMIKRHVFCSKKIHCNIKHRTSHTHQIKEENNYWSSIP